MNDALPFFPPLEPEQMVQVADRTARRLVEADKTAFKFLFNLVSGWDEMPARQVFATIASRIRAYDMALQQQIAQLDAQLSVGMGAEIYTPEEAMAYEQASQQMWQERAMLEAQLAQPGVSFFQALAGIDASMAKEISDQYAAGLRRYGGAA